MEFEMEKLKCILVACFSRKDHDNESFKGLHLSSMEIIAGDDKLVCITSGVSFSGLAIVNCLLCKGYSVKIIVHTREEMEKWREIETRGEVRWSSSNGGMEAVMAKLTEIESLKEAFERSGGVFRTVGFTNPAGLSGYTLWYALGKLKAEKAAWRIAKEKGLKLATVCPGLITGPDFFLRNPTPTIAYLKAHFNHLHSYTNLMGFIENEERRLLMEFEMEELKRILVVCSNPKDHDDEGFKGLHFSSAEMIVDDNKLVCVTSGVSFLGLAIVDRLLRQGYSVKIIVHTQEEMEKLREIETRGEMRWSSSNCRMEAVMAKLTEIESLKEAFEGSGGVFHTAGFTDPAGLSGYTKSMAEIEVKACENVIMACTRTASVRKCVLTSSLLACIWRRYASSQRLSPVINHQSWSDESLCIQKKLWYALGKLKAEKAAWRIAKEKGLKLATVCPGLITGPDFFLRNPTPTIAYLKGAQEMYAEGVVATADVTKLAEAQVCVLEAMNKAACGRYICFDRVIDREDEAEKLAKQIGIPAYKICGNPSHPSSNIPPIRSVLSNKKLLNLMSTTLRTCYNQC